MAEIDSLPFFTRASWSTTVTAMARSPDRNSVDTLTCRASTGESVSLRREVGPDGKTVGLSGDIFDTGGYFHRATSGHFRAEARDGKVSSLVLQRRDESRGGQEVAVAHVYQGAALYESHRGAPLSTRITLDRDVAPAANEVGRVEEQKGNQGAVDVEAFLPDESLRGAVEVVEWLVSPKKGQEPSCAKLYEHVREAANQVPEKE